MSNETKVGILVALALCALGWLSVKSGNFSLGGLTGSSERELATTFTDVNGLTEGGAVKVAGVDVGKITAIKLQPNGTATVHYTVKSSVYLPENVVAEIASNGLIGDKFLALVVSVPGAGAGVALPKATHTVPGREGTSQTGNIAGQFGQVADDLKAMTGTLRSVLGNPDNAQKLQSIIDGLSNLGTSLQGNQTNQMMDNFNKTAANLAAITSRLEKGEGTLGQLLSNKPGQGNTLSDLNGALKDLREVMAKINNGQGTIGKLVNDPETADKLNSALDTFSEASNRLDQIRTEIGFEGSTLTAEKGVGMGEAYANIQTRPTRFYALGYTSDGFANKSTDRNDTSNPYYNKEFGKNGKITAQFGQIYKGAGVGGEDVDVRVGLKNNTGGIGADTKLPLTGIPYVGDKKLALSADLYDFGAKYVPHSSNPQLDFKAKMDLVGQTVYGLVGYTNVLNSKYASPQVGVGIKFQDDDLKYVATGKAL